VLPVVLDFWGPSPDFDRGRAGVGYQREPTTGHGCGPLASPEQGQARTGGLTPYREISGFGFGPHPARDELLGSAAGASPTASALWVGLVADSRPGVLAVATNLVTNLGQ
jgi:hypothetical protein